MGRPLKIAKSQAIVTITAVSGTTVTISQDTAQPPTGVGLLRGMPFVVASNVGNLVAGTIYWVLEVTGANTFTVSSVDPSANPNYTAFALGTAGPVTVKASVAVVDGYFNNPNGGVGYPATNANTYSVVGGNTGIYGKQVLCNVAIGVNGTGTIYANVGDANVCGIGTDFANTVAVGTSIEANGTVLGSVATVTGYVTNAVTDTVQTGSFVVTSGDATDFVVNGPVTFSANIGGLIVGTVYFVKTVANATHFTVSATSGGANVAVNDETTASSATQDIIVLNATSTASVADSSWVYATTEAGFIVRQKGKQKYLVYGGTSGLTGACYTSNAATLTSNTMSIIATYANAATVKVQSLSDHTVELFTTNSGPIATGNIVLEDAAPAYGTFNTAYAPNVANAQPYPIVTIDNA